MYCVHSCPARHARSESSSALARVRAIVNSFVAQAVASLKIMRAFLLCHKYVVGLNLAACFELAVGPRALRTEHGGQHWDYCFTEDQVERKRSVGCEEPGACSWVWVRSLRTHVLVCADLTAAREAGPYVTRNGCHCMPEYQIDGVKRAPCCTAFSPQKHGDLHICGPPCPQCGACRYEGCSMIKLGEKEFMGCAVLEDGEGMSCQAPFEIEGTTLRADECLFMEDQKELLHAVWYGGNAVQAPVVKPYT
eukprot:6273593-Amphidinium_carterae.1